MKIALIHPAITYRSESKPIQDYANHWYKDTLSRSFNINLLRLASLTSEGHEIKLIDEHYQEIDYEEKFDVIAVTAMTYQVEKAYSIAEKFKKQYPCHTILGGIHASVMPDEALKTFESVCVGEVENVWEAYLADVLSGHPKKIYTGGLADLEKEPTMRYPLVEDWVKLHGKNRVYFFPTMASRGCPRGCDYCSATYLFNKRYRKKGTLRILSEIQEIKKTARALGINNYRVAFCDDNFVIDRKRMKDLLTALLDENISYMASLDIAASDDPEILELLSTSGCKIVSIGLESLEVNILEDLGKWKKSQRSKVEKNIQAFFDHAIMPSVNFMVGSDGTDLRLFKNIRKFLQEFPVPYNLSFFTPFPGTPYFDSLKKEGRLRADTSWTDYNLINMVFEPRGMSRERLYEEFYSIRSEYNHSERYMSCLNHLNHKKAGFDRNAWLLQDGISSTTL